MMSRFDDLIARVRADAGLRARREMQRRQEGAAIGFPPRVPKFSEHDEEAVVSYEEDRAEERIVQHLYSIGIGNGQ